jgi:hypothetical protein
MEYSEHVGKNLQLLGRKGETMYLYSLIIAINSVFIIEPGKYADHACLHLSEFSFSRRAPCDDYKVVLQKPVFQLPSENIAQTPFNLVPNNGIPDFSAYSKSESAAGQFVW